MSIRLSTGLRNFMTQHGSFKTAMQGGKVEFRTGSQPATPETAVSGTLICTFTAASGARTNEVVASGTVTLTGGASGSVDTVTVNSVNLIPAGAVPYNASLNQTAADLATAINLGQSSPEYRAEASGAVVTIYAMLGAGAAPNGFVVTATLTTITASYANMASGVTSINGLSWGNAASGLIDRLSTQTWSGVNADTGTVGWFRAYGAVTDAGSTDSAGTTIRMDGSLGISGADLNGNTSFTASATSTLTSLGVTLPASE